LFPAEDLLDCGEDVLLRGVGVVAGGAEQPLTGFAVHIKGQVVVLTLQSTVNRDHTMQRMEVLTVQAQSLDTRETVQDLRPACTLLTALHITLATLTIMKRRNVSGSKPPAKQISVQTQLDLNAPKPAPQPVHPQGHFPRDQVHIACWNLNGLRAAINKDPFAQFIKRLDLEVLGLNETKLQDGNIADIKRLLMPYFKFQYYACSQKKKGYSGVGILSKIKPLDVIMGLGDGELDVEGRVITAEFEHFRVVVVYIPSAGMGLKRLQWKVRKWNVAFHRFITGLMRRGKPVIILGDMNVVHRDLDICTKDRYLRDIPATTLEEKNSFTSLLGDQLVDTYRSLHPDGNDYSWYKTDVEFQRTQGWRLDYALVSASFLPRVIDSFMHDQVRASDHMPIEVVVENASDS